VPSVEEVVEGDTVDLVAWKLAGRTADVVEAILAANPGLAALGPILPIGTAVIVPEVAATTATPATVALWD
jgi:phage tail protein X